jgi:hypothetical protein
VNCTSFFRQFRLLVGLANARSLIVSYHEPIYAQSNSHEVDSGLPGDEYRSWCTWRNFRNIVSPGAGATNSPWKFSPLFIEAIITLLLKYHVVHHTSSRYLPYLLSTWWPSRVLKWILTKVVTCAAPISLWSAPFDHASFRTAVIRLCRWAELPLVICLRPCVNLYNGSIYHVLLAVSDGTLRWPPCTCWWSSLSSRLWLLCDGHRRTCSPVTSHSQRASRLHAVLRLAAGRDQQKPSRYYLLYRLQGSTRINVSCDSWMTQACAHHVC